VPNISHAVRYALCIHHLWRVGHNSIDQSKYVLKPDDKDHERVGFLWYLSEIDLQQPTYGEACKNRGCHLSDGGNHQTKTTVKGLEPSQTQTDVDEYNAICHCQKRVLAEAQWLYAVLEQLTMFRCAISLVLYG